MIYADYNATTPCLPVIAEEMRRLLVEDLGNPNSRMSPGGRRARAAVDQARKQVATAVGAHTDEIFFTSGATEAANAIVLGVMQRLLPTRPQLILSAVEHAAVREPALACASAGAQVIQNPVSSEGVVKPDEMKVLLHDTTTALVCVMGANNETGVMQPLDEVVALAHGQGALVFSDLTQMPGKCRFNVHDLGVDFACFSAHKCYGPPGIGALYKRRGLSLPPLIYGGGQEEGLRSGTENVPGIVGMGMAMEQVTRDISNRIQHLERLTGLFENEIQSRLPGVIIQGLAADRLPGTSMLSHPGLSHSWLSRLSGVDASSGSACASLHEEPSAVLLAMGVSADMAANSLRISFGAPTREEDALAVAQEVITSARALLA